MANFDWKKWDGFLIGAGLGLIVAYPSIATTVSTWINSIIPSTWTFIGTFTKPALIILAGAIVGLIVDRT